MLKRRALFHLPLFVQLFILFVILKQLVWIAFIPVWQFPDEQAHFAQVQRISEGIPYQSTKNTSREVYQSELYLETNRDSQGNNAYTHRPTHNIEYTNSIYGKYEAAIKALPHQHRTELVIQEATEYPPLYYQFVSTGYNLFYQEDLLARVMGVRLVNLVLFLLTAYVAWKSAKLLFTTALPALTFVVLVLFHPMYSFVFGGVNSDNLFNLLFSAGIYMCLLLLSGKYNIAHLLLSLSLTLVAILTKPQGKLLPLLFIYPLAYIMFRSAKSRLRNSLALLIFLGLSIGTALYKIMQGKQFLPDIPGGTPFFSEEVSLLEHIRWTVVHTYREVMPWYWGVFRWLSLTYPRMVHRVLNWFVLIALVGNAFYFVKKIRSPDKEFIKWGFLVYASALYFVALTIFDYFFRISHNFSLGLQGRYFFPVLFAHMGLIVFGVQSLLSEKYQRFVFPAIAAGFILLHTYAQFYVVSSYYKLWPLQQLFIQASQYKPFFFKSPVLEVLLSFYCLTLAMFIYFISRKRYELKKN